MIPIPTGGLFGLVTGLGVMASLIQVVVPPDVSLIEHVERLGFNGVMLFFVLILWRKIASDGEMFWLKLEAKDALLMSTYSKTAEALTASRMTSEEMSKTLNVMRDTVDKMHTFRTDMQSDPPIKRSR